MFSQFLDYSSSDSSSDSDLNVEQKIENIVKMASLSDDSILDIQERILNDFKNAKKVDEELYKSAIYIVGKSASTITFTFDKFIATLSHYMTDEGIAHDDEEARKKVTKIICKIILGDNLNKESAVTNHIKLLSIPTPSEKDTMRLKLKILGLSDKFANILLDYKDKFVKAFNNIICLKNKLLKYIAKKGKTKEQFLEWLEVIQARFEIEMKREILLQLYHTPAPDSSSDSDSCDSSSDSDDSTNKEETTDKPDMASCFDDEMKEIIDYLQDAPSAAAAVKKPKP